MTVHQRIYSFPKGYSHTMYIDSPLESIEDWRTELEIIRSAQHEDDITIRIDSPGGNVNVATAFMGAISECQGHVKTVIEGTCASAASMIFLAGHSKQVSELGEILVHTASFGTGGAEHEVYDYVIHSRKQIFKLLDRVYSGFLTPEELDLVKQGKQHYMDSDEIVERLDMQIAKETELELECMSREELKEVAEQLGIKVISKTSDTKLRASIKEKVDGINN